MLAKLDITQTANRITLNARERVTINGGGSYTTWDARGITSGTTGAHTVHAASHGRAGPKGLPVADVQFPRSELSAPSHQDVAYPMSL